MTTLAQEFGFTADQAQAVIAKGFELVEAGNLDGALAIFDGLLVLNERDGAVHAARGAVLQQMGRTREAEDAYNTAIELDPQALLARVNRGELRLRRGDKGGMEDLRIAASIESPVKSRAERLIKQFTI